MIKKMIIGITLFFSQGCTHILYMKTIKGEYKVELDFTDNEIESDKTVIKGTIKDISNAHFLPYSLITLDNTKYGISADSAGKYYLKVPSGNYRIIAKSAGNTDLKTKQMCFKSKEVITINFFLGTKTVY